MKTRELNKLTLVLLVSGMVSWGGFSHVMAQKNNWEHQELFSEKNYLTSSAVDMHLELDYLPLENWMLDDATWAHSTTGVSIMDILAVSTEETQSLEDWMFVEFISNTTTGKENILVEAEEPALALEPWMFDFNGLCAGLGLD
jgi:hypothetical protein